MKFYHNYNLKQNKLAEILPCASELSVKEQKECVAEFAKFANSAYPNDLF